MLIQLKSETLRSPAVPCPLHVLTQFAHLSQPATSPNTLPPSKAKTPLFGPNCKVVLHLSVPFPVFLLLRTHHSLTLG